MFAFEFLNVMKTQLHHYKFFIDIFAKLVKFGSHLMNPN